MKFMLAAKLSHFVSILVLMLTIYPSAWAVVTNSAHDFSKLGWRGGEICISCHTPQNANSAQTSQLWDPAASTTNFTLYTSPSVDVTGTGQPGGTSRLCLSCHDGTLGVDSFAGATGVSIQTGASAIGRGSNLHDGHPISIKYDSSNTALTDPLSATATVGSKKTKVKTGTINKILLTEGSIQCSSCHDVHNNYTAADPLLKISVDGGQLCLTCHEKYHQNYRRLFDLHGKTTKSLEALIVNGKLRCDSCHDVHIILAGEKSLTKKKVVGSELCLNCHDK